MGCDAKFKVGKGFCWWEHAMGEGKRLPLKKSSFDKKLSPFHQYLWQQEGCFTLWDIPLEFLGKCKKCVHWKAEKFADVLLQLNSFERFFFSFLSWMYAKLKHNRFRASASFSKGCVLRQHLSFHYQNLITK